MPADGQRRRRFGRNFLNETFPDTANLLTPNPRTVSLELLTRTTFQPATILNVLAAAWIQFQVHDWFMHPKGVWRHTHNIPLADGDPWHERPMRVPIRRPIRRRSPDRSVRPPTSTRTPTGGTARRSTAEPRPSRRSCGPGATARCWSAPTASSVRPVTGLEITGFTENSWVGLSLLHSLFALEHNAICDRLKNDYRSGTTNGCSSRRG